MRQQTRQHPPRRLTKEIIDGLMFNGKPYLVRDTVVKGFMIGVNTHCKTYKIQADLWRDGAKVRTVRRTLGNTDQLTLTEARARAMTVLAQIKRGIDPNAALLNNGASWTVEQMFSKYTADLRKREKSERTIIDIQSRVDRYLPDWKKLPIKEITKAMARAKHDHITSAHGKVVANRTLKVFSTAYKHADRILDAELPANPVRGVTFNKEPRKGRVVLPDELPEWWRKLQKLPNPLRKCMHELGLLSGLRPGTLVSIRREWIDLDKQCISIPKMKSGRSFDLPLSDHMCGVVRQALHLGDLLHPDSPWLFPTRGRNGEVKHTQVWKEENLPYQTGHCLRHTHRTIAARIGLGRDDARLLLDHKVTGIDGVYVHESALFDRLLDAQERMTAAILELLV